MKVVLLDDYQGVGPTYHYWDQLRDRVEIVSNDFHISDPDELVAALRGVQIVVCMRERTALAKSVIDRLDDVRLIVTTGPYNAVIDVAAAKAKGIEVCGTGGALHNTSELTWALILACARHVPSESANIRNGGWMQTVGTDLFGRTLGLLGAGRLGGLVGAVGKAFGMQLIAWSQNLTDERAAEIGATRVDKDELFARADVLSVHLVLSERTRSLLGARELSLMKRRAILVNTSRGPIIDETALAEALRHRTIAAAGIDVFSVEPLPAEHPFRSLDNLICTPHLGYVTDGCYEIFYRDIVEDIAAWLDGSPIRVVPG
jgi:phosphoglycerate dehydrogenase-like enzyme